MQYIEKILQKFCTYENLLLIAGFLLSLRSSILVMIFLLGLLIYIEKGVEGCIKALLFISIRTIINPVVGINIEGNTQNIKWLVLFILAANIFLKCKISVREDQEKLRNIAFFGGLFVLYTGIISLTISSYPTISIFKLFAYSFVFFSIVTGVASTYREFDWLGYLLKLLTPIFLISFMTISLSLAYITNGTAFQGIIMHPNMFGVLSALYISILLCKMASGEYKVSYLLMLGLNSVMSYLCDSRTGMLAAFISLLVFLFTCKVKLRTKLITLFFSVAVTLFIALIFSDVSVQISEYIKDFIYKGDSADILYSREGQIETFIKRFEKSYILGTGFSVPYAPGIKVFSFSFDKIVEPGNLLFAVLGDTGTIGFLLFSIFMMSIFIRNKSFMRILFIAPIAVSMGEMVFFSTNTIGPILYLLFGIYIFYDGEKISKLGEEYEI